ncbi:tyrosine recombinase XerC [Deinococcus xinjiangensis]|uniref:Tyrosine recombinase XerC n=2 Tax=Deinococcus xinjiangensis TaxID=457454 RepID=A0ABP9VEP7_9DEIO
MMVYRLDLQARAQAWADMDVPEMRRRATEAARDMDVESLWSLTEAHLLLNGLSGAKVSRHTIRAYRKGLETFLEYARMVGLQLLRPRPNHGVAYARWLEAKGYNTSTVRVRLAASRKLFAALRWAGATDATPFADVRPAPDPVPRTEKRKPYSDVEVEELVRASDLEEKVILLLGAHAGLRVSEIAGLQRLDVHLDGEQPYLMVTGKRQKRQGVPLSRTLAKALYAWLNATPNLQGRVLSSGSVDYVQNRVKAVCERTGIPYSRRQVHGLRHSAGTRIYSDTADLLAVRDHLRHADITSSEIYVEYSRKMKTSPVKAW